MFQPRLSLHKLAPPCIPLKLRTPALLLQMPVSTKLQSTSMASTNSNTTSSTRNQALLSHPPIVICGPSGTGKSTILKKLFASYPTHFGFSISHTTRAPRGQEQNGTEYHFVTREQFTSLVEQGEFLEHATFGKNLYGTTFGAIAAVAEQGRTCILDIEMEGVKQLRQHPELGPKARILFLKPPSLQVLEGRLRSRGTDSEEAVLGRLEQAEREMEFARRDEMDGGGIFDRVVVNEDLEECWRAVRAWVVEGVAGLGDR